jgi:phytoene dehydrogenase-like protein
MNEPRIDVLIIGAGLAGLAAAQTAQRAGATVMVIDGQQQGGRARTDDHDGYLFNRGPHALYLGGHAQRVLEHLGVEIAGGSPSSSAFGSRASNVASLPGNPRTLLSTSLLGWRGKLAIGKLFGGLARIRLDNLHDVSMQQWLESRRLSADAAALVNALVRLATYANAPHSLSAAVGIGQLQLAIGSGVRYLHGGWEQMVNQLAAGLRIQRATALSIEADSTGGRSGVIVGTAGAEATTVHCAAVVLAPGTPAAAATILGRTPFDVGPPIEAACLDLGTIAPATPGIVLGIDEPLYLSNHCPPARLAQPGRHVVHVARYLAADDDLDHGAQRARLEQHAALAGLTVGGNIEVARYLHRMTVCGALPLAAAGGVRGRPMITAAGIDGVFLAGDWVGDQGHLADASLASGTAAGARAAELARQRR